MICALALDQLGQERAGQRDEAGDVGVDHRLDPLPVGVRQRVGRRRKAGIVEQQVDLAPRRRQLGQAFDRLAVAHVDLERQEGVAKLLLKLCAAGRRAGRCRSTFQPPADELARRGFAEARGRAGDQDGLVMALLPSSSRRASTRSAGANAKLLGDRDADRAHALRGSAISAASSAGSPALRRSSSVPIPVRSRNRCARRSSPSVAASAARARALGIVWRLARHCLQMPMSELKEANWPRS